MPGFRIDNLHRGGRGEGGGSGQAATIDVRNTTTGAPGSAATVVNVGTTSAALLDFIIPRGAPGADSTVPGPPGASAYQVAVANGFIGTETEWLASLEGAPGDDGDPGAAATITVASTTTGAPGTNASVTNTGTASAAALNFTIPRGNAGLNGSAATITVASTTTGAPGSNASVTNSGTSSAAALNFVIPRGDQGLQGPPGPSKRIEVHSGTTNASGLFNVTFSPAFPAPPVVLVEPHTTTGYVWIKVSVTASGFSYRLGNRGTLTVLALEVLAGAVTNVSGAAVKALVVEA